MTEVARPDSMAVIINPAAGTGRTRLDPDAARRLVAGAGFDPEILVTRLPGGAAELAAQAAERHPLVAVAGGDGTCGEAARGLAGTGAAMVLLPTGSGNDFAKGLGIGSARAGLAAARKGESRALDLASFAGRPFVNTCGLFFDGEVSFRAAAKSRRWGGLRYAAATVGLIGRYGARTAAWRFDDADGSPRELSGRWLLAEVGNGRRCGGGFLLNPLADPGDGLLDFCLVREMGWGRFLRTLPRGLNGSHLGRDGVEYLQRGGAVLMAGETTAVHWDGEVGRLPAGEHEFTLQRGVLKVMLPGGNRS